MKIVEVSKIVASAGPAELLAEDAGAPHMAIAAHPVWQSVFTGDLPKPTLVELVSHFYPVVAGPGRYAFIAKIGVIDRDDGTRLFQRLHRVTHDEAFDADKGWKRMAEAVGADPGRLSALLETPSAEAADLIDVVRRHGEQASPAEAAGVAWVLERQMPAWMGGLADALARHYGVPDDALSYLRTEAAEAGEAEAWVAHLMDRYFMSADPYNVFEARRAMREAGWAWTALTEQATRTA